MRTTDIKYLIGLKKSGSKLTFFDCPQCNRFFGTDETDIETCCVECDAEYALQNLQFEISKSSRLTTLSLSKPFF
jgi:hypothetical protein